MQIFPPPAFPLSATAAAIAFLWRCLFSHSLNHIAGTKENHSKELRYLFKLLCTNTSNSSQKNACRHEAKGQQFVNCYLAQAFRLLCYRRACVGFGRRYENKGISAERRMVVVVTTSITLAIYIINICFSLYLCYYNLVVLCLFISKQK